MEKGFYHPSTGYWQTNSEPSKEVLSTYPEGTQEVPIKPGSGYQYDGTQWVPPTQEWLDAEAAKLVRNTRDAKLRREVDPIVTNPLRWQELSAEAQAAWGEYRRKLLDISDQQGFPHVIVWPSKP
jgi:hypothetical protein